MHSASDLLRARIAGSPSSLVSDDIVARVRAMIADLADQLQQGAERGNAAAADELVQALCGQRALVSHLHALAIEWRLTQRLQTEAMIDPVRPPLIEQLVSSGRPARAALAGKLLTAQAQFCHAQRHMRQPLAELPRDLLRATALAMATCHPDAAEAQRRATGLEPHIHAEDDGRWSRLDLIERVLGEIDEPEDALSVHQAGVPIFLSALALASGQDRDLIAFATDRTQAARFALSLAAAGLPAAARREQFIAIHPSVAQPGTADLRADDAAVILSASNLVAGA